MNTIKEKINLFIKKIKLSKLNFLNHKFKKYIIKYEENENMSVKWLIMSVIKWKFGRKTAVLALDGFYLPMGTVCAIS